MKQMFEVKGETFCEEICQIYCVMAVIRAMGKLGYNVGIKARKTSSGQRAVTVMGIR